MSSLDLFACFAAAARHASFAGAARELGLSPSAVSKNVARLERRVGVRLFHRTTRVIRLSPDGEALYERCQRVLEEVEALEASAVGVRAGPAGTLRLDAPLVYGRRVVLPVLTRLRARHPGLRIDLRFSDQFVDIIREGLDAAVRVGPLSDSRLVARSFDQQVIWTVASPAYLRRHGRPEAPEDVLGHACVTFRLPSSGRDRPWEFRSGRRTIAIAPDAAVRLGDGEAIVQAALGGLGLVQVPSYLAEDEVRRGRLVEVLEGHRAPPMPISLVYPSQRYVPPRVRALADALGALRPARGRTEAAQ